MFTGELMEKVPVSIPCDSEGFTTVIEPFPLELETHEKDR